MKRRDFLAGTASAAALTVIPEAQGALSLDKSVISQGDLIACGLLTKVFCLDPIYYSDSVEFFAESPGSKQYWTNRCVYNRGFLSPRVAVLPCKPMFWNGINVEPDQVRVPLLKWNNIEDVEITIIKMLLLAKEINLRPFWPNKKQNGKGKVFAWGQGEYKEIKISPAAQKVLGNNNIFLDASAEYIGVAPYFTRCPNQIIDLLGLCIVYSDNIRIKEVK